MIPNATSPLDLGSIFNAGNPLFESLGVLLWIGVAIGFVTVVLLFSYFLSKGSQEVDSSDESEETSWDEEEEESEEEEEQESPAEEKPDWYCCHCDTQNPEPFRVCNKCGHPRCRECEVANQSNGEQS